MLIQMVVNVEADLMLVLILVPALMLMCKIQAPLSMFSSCIIPFSTRYKSHSSCRPMPWWQRLKRSSLEEKASSVASLGEYLLTPETINYKLQYKYFSMFPFKIYSWVRCGLE